MDISKLILASSSPRRRELLGEAGYSFEIISPDINEFVSAGEDAETHVMRMAMEKAAAVFELHSDRTVLAADTIVVLDKRILGKPVDEEDARSLLGDLSGRSHQVMTAFAIRSPDSSHQQVCVTDVRFRCLSTEEIRRYVDSGEPMDKAGAYGIQGKAAGFVEHVSGSYTNVVGLPVAEVIAALQAP